MNKKQCLHLPNGSFMFPLRPYFVNTSTGLNHKMSSTTVTAAFISNMIISRPYATRISYLEYIQNSLEKIQTSHRIVFFEHRIFFKLRAPPSTMGVLRGGGKI